MKKSHRRLELIDEYGRVALNFLDGKTVDEWRGDIKLRYAVAHALAGVVENLKEYSKDAGNLQNLVNMYPQIPWNLVIRFRDKLIHHYKAMDQDVMFEFVTHDLPELLAAICEIAPLPLLNFRQSDSKSLTSRLPFYSAALWTFVATVNDPFNNLVFKNQHTDPSRYYGYYKRHGKSCTREKISHPRPISPQW